MSLTLQTIAWTDMLEELALARSMREFVQIAERLACSLGGGQRACLYAYSLSDDRLLRPAAVGDDPWHLSVGNDTVPGRCALGWEPVAMEVKAADSAAIPGLEPWEGDVLALPVKLHGSLVGVLAVAATSFGDEQVQQLENLARVVGVMQETVAQREDFTALSTRIQSMLVVAVERLPGALPGHVARIASLSSELGGLLDLSARSRELLWQAAHYHDVGKLALHGRTPWEAEQHHPQAGATFLAACRPLAALAPLVEAHHERYDGSGFPRGRRGDEIPVEAWILSLAEDLDEFWMDHADEPLAEVVAAFFKQKAAAHHPLVIDALSGLVDSGRLESLLTPPRRT